MGAENVIRLCDLRVFVDEPTEDIVSSHATAAGRRCPARRRCKWRLLLQRPMGPMPVIVPYVLLEHPTQVFGSNDEQLIQALTSDGPHPSFREGIRHGRANQGGHDPGAVGCEHRVERVGELGVAIADREPHSRARCRSQAAVGCAVTPAT